MRLIEMIGHRFGRLVVIERVADKIQPSGQTCPKYRANCDCGNAVEVIGICLRQGTSQSCGCLRTDLIVRHGESSGAGRTPEYRAWNNMITRCEVIGTPYYENYGGRGIAVCKRWRESYEAFLIDMGRRPSQAHSLDRKNNDGNYNPRNCRWATKSEQTNNRRPRKRL